MLISDTELRERLERRRGDWPRIAEAADISHSWISQFVRQKIPNPGYATLRRLAECMDAMPHDEDTKSARRAAA